MLKLMRFLKPYSISILGILVLMFIQTLSQLYLPTLMSDIVDVGIVNGDTGFIYRTGLYMLLVAAVGAICIIIASYLSARTGVGFSQALRKDVFTKVENFSLRGFNHFGTASLITRTTNDITQIQRVMILILRMMISAPMMAIGGIIMAVSKDARLSLVIVVVVPILAIAIYWLANKAIPLFKIMQVKLDQLNLVFRENLTGIRVIRAFNRTDYEKKRFEVANRDLTETAIKVNKIMALMMPLMMLLLNLTTIVVVWFGGIRIDNGFMQVGDLMAFIQYIMQIMFSLLMFSMMFVMVPRASASATRINEVLETDPEIVDPEVCKSIQEREEKIEFRNVSFSYTGAEEPALDQISFSAKAGEVIAIIGGTGSGKSTLINLIPRFYDVDQGQILIDGRDVREISQQELRAKIGLVPQKAVLFTGTIVENIRYGKLEASLEEIKKATEIAQATEFIEKMENTYDSIISQGGTNISGGQKQRLSIARALIRRPEIYLFDDSFSALDYKTAARLQQALKQETDLATVLIITQRVSTAMNADRILVLDQGEIVGNGDHQTLLKNCEVYQQIVTSQLTEEELA